MPSPYDVAPMRLQRHQHYALSLSTRQYRYLSEPLMFYHHSWVLYWLMSGLIACADEVCVVSYPLLSQQVKQQFSKMF